MNIIIAIGISLFFLIFKNIFTKYILKIGYRITNKTKSTIDDDILNAFKRPLRMFISILGLYLSLRYLAFSQSFNETLKHFFRSSVIIIIAWGLYNLEGTYSILFDRMGRKLNINTNNVLKPFLSRALRIITVVITIGIVAEEFEYDVSGFVAGLGLGGLAIAMAAKDTLSNVFGGIVIIMDKPFDIGDWISSTETEGVVEDINFRSTKIRAFDKAIITVPNSKLVDSSVINYSRRNLRRINFKLGLTYDTSKEKMKKCVESIEKMLISHDNISKDMILVKFDEFNSSSLDILIYCFANTSSWEEFLDIKQDVNFNIMNIVEEEGASIAFPSRSIYFENKMDIKKGEGL
ncbi:mechanosensitive ion channel family protein [Dethiothermospora halolimnae]|uniref:mechanosensitive ion channel family protein n=1 Tax=Dethiothermospora halolimnae TaxID=3114390 RepID=UPI003CCBE9A5